MAKLRCVSCGSVFEDKSVDPYLHYGYSDWHNPRKGKSTLKAYAPCPVCEVSRWMDIEEAE